MAVILFTHFRLCCYRVLFHEEVIQEGVDYSKDGVGNVLCGEVDCAAEADDVCNAYQLAHY